MSHLFSTLFSHRDSSFVVTPILFILLSPSTKGEHVSLAQLVKFMNEKQRDPSLNEILYPLYDEKRCMEIITAHEPHQENIDNSICILTFVFLMLGRCIRCG